MLLRRRGSLLLAGLCAGLSAAALVPSGGCVLPDYCILIEFNGTDWCATMGGAQMWPAGQPEFAEPISDDIFACTCFNEIEQGVLTNKVPLDEFTALVTEIEQVTREHCASLVPEGFEHNCDLVDVPNAPTITDPYEGGSSNDCHGSCSFINPPPGGSCPELDPYECNDEPAGGGDEAGDDDAGGDDEGPGASLYAEEHVNCEGTRCTIDRAFAESLWRDPNALLAEDARLIFDDASARFVLVDVDVGSLAHTLGLRSGDHLESVEGVIIDDLEIAIEVAIVCEQSDAVELRVLRGARAIDFHYSML